MLKEIKENGSGWCTTPTDQLYDASHPDENNMRKKKKVFFFF